MISMVENKCVVLGCNALCCIDPEIIFASTYELREYADGRVKIIFCDPSEVAGQIWEVQKKELNAIIVEDIPIEIFGPQARAYIVGSCIHLDESTSNCLWSEDPRRPLSCRAEPIGGPYCNRIRKDYRLATFAPDDTTNFYREEQSV